MKVGWIGLGQIGEPMARKVLGAGHALVGHSRGGRPREALTAAGGRVTGSLLETVEGADVVVAALFYDEQVRESVRDSGVLQALRPGVVLALHTTGSPALVEALAAEAPAGVQVLDATFSGVVANVERGDVRLFVGGEVEALARARPVLATYCDPIVHLGGVGAGRRLKLINNLLFAAQVALAAEGLRAVRQMGLPLEPSAQALGLASGGSFALGVFQGGEIEAVVERLARYLDKDVDAAREAAAAEGLNLRLLEAAAAQWGKGR